MFASFNKRSKYNAPVVVFVYFGPAQILCKRIRSMQSERQHNLRGGSWAVWRRAAATAWKRDRIANKSLDSLRFCFAQQ